MKKKKLGNIIIEPVEDPANPGQLYKGTFGWTEHAGVNYHDAAGRYHKGWIPLALWELLEEAA